MLYAKVNDSIINQYYFYYIYNGVVYTYDETLKRFFKSVTYKTIEEFNLIKHNLKLVRLCPAEVSNAIRELENSLNKEY